MTTADRDALIAAFDKGINEALRYYETQGAKSKAKVGEWGAKETFIHCIHWHRVTADGMESALWGMGPTRTYQSSDELNAKAVAAMKDRTFSQLLEEARAVHARLLKAARAVPDLDATVIQRFDGTLQPARLRLQTIPNHWKTHVDALKQAEPSSSGAKKPAGACAAGVSPGQSREACDMLRR